MMSRMTIGLELGTFVGEPDFWTLETTPTTLFDETNIMSRLPLELKTTILELAARSDHSKRTTRSLSLVSREVSQRVKPILYESLYLDTSESSEMIYVAMKILTPEFIHKYVKNVCLLSSEDHHVAILRLCTGVRYLLILSEIASEDLAVSRPEHLALNFHYLFDPPCPGRFATFPLFSRVKYFEMYDLMLDFEFEALPCLTHLALYKWKDSTWTEESTNGVLRILERCEGLEYLVVLVEDAGEMESVRVDAGNLFTLPRVWLCVQKEEIRECWEDALDGRKVWDRGTGD